MRRQSQLKTLAKANAIIMTYTGDIGENRGVATSGQVEPRPATVGRGARPLKYLIHAPNLPWNCSFQQHLPCHALRWPLRPAPYTNQRGSQRLGINAAQSLSP